MERKRDASEFPQDSGSLKRPKIKDEYDSKPNLSAIPMTPSTLNAPVTAARPAQPPQSSPTPPSGGAQQKSRKRGWHGNSITVGYGNDKVSAHYDRNLEVVTFTIVRSRSHGHDWISKDVEQEIFRRLNAARFPVVPHERWGFLERFLKKQDKRTEKWIDHNMRVDSGSSHYTYAAKVYRDESLVTGGAHNVQPKPPITSHAKAPNPTSATVAAPVALVEPFGHPKAEQGKSSLHSFVTQLKKDEDEEEKKNNLPQIKENDQDGNKVVTM